MNVPREILLLIIDFIDDPKSFFNVLRVNKKINIIAKNLINKKKSNVEPVGFLREVKEAGELYHVLPNGKREGEYKFWYINGQLHLNCFYKDDELEGEYKSWYENGQLQTHCFYKEDKLEGEYKYWYENRQLWTQYFFKEDKLEGEYKEWNEHGKLVIFRIYRKNKIVKEINLN